MGAQLVREVASKTSDMAGDRYHYGDHSGTVHLPRRREERCRRCGIRWPSSAVSRRPLNSLLRK